jgi:hypothetical protein
VFKPDEKSAVDDGVDSCFHRSANLSQIVDDPAGMFLSRVVPGHFLGKTDTESNHRTIRIIRHSQFFLAI